MIAVCINIAFSVVLSIKNGIVGVFVGTTITYLFMITVCSMILNKYFFRCTEYLKDILKGVFAVAFAVLVMRLFGDISSQYVIVAIVWKAVLVTISYWTCFFAVNSKNENFRFYIAYFTTIIKNIVRKGF